LVAANASSFSPVLAGSNYEVAMNEDDAESQQPQCVITVSAAFEVDGKLVRAVVAKHADGFTCLRIVEADGPVVDEGQAGGDPGRNG
jgi:hypothetical protein